MEKMDEALQQANVLKGTCNKYAASDGKDGIDAEEITALETQIDDATTKNTDQKKAVQVVTDLTKEQTECMSKGGGLVQRIKEAAKGAFGEDDKVRMKEFHVGQDIPRTVKGLTSELKYMKVPALAHKSALAKHGIKDADIEMSTALANELSEVDDKQEAAKKVQKATTKSRNSSMKDLRKIIRKIQHSANSIFANQPLVLIEFESITKGRGGGGKTPPPEPPKQPGS